MKETKGFFSELGLSLAHLFYALITLPVTMYKLFLSICKGMSAKPQIALLVMILIISADHLVIIGKYRAASDPSSRELVLQDSLSRYKESCTTQLIALKQLRSKPVVKLTIKKHRIHKHHVESRDSII